VSALASIHLTGPYWLSSTLKAVVALAVVSGGALVFGYVFLFKMMSFMQSRLGPMEAGPGGTMQPLAEGVKFLQKEDLIPALADKWVFALAPSVVLMSTFLLFLVIPAGPDLVIARYDTGIFLALAVSSLSVLGILMAGWSSANKYSLIGALRAAGQLIAYELPLVLAVVGVVIQAGSMSLPKIIAAQRHTQVFGLSISGVPYIIPQFIGFVIFLIAVQAELTQTPFDMPIAESELVAGYQTEYTGFRFLVFFISEFATAFAYSAIAATIFLGGWYLPLLPHRGLWGNLLGVAVLGAKIMFVAFFIFWVRFTYPRFREDQLQSFAWKFLIPLALVNIMATAVLKVVF
jgi:NADH-quinone oxidoreductase subunit H